MRTILLAALLMSGCADWHAQKSCTFGGATPAEDAACAAQNFGSEGALYAVQQEAAEHPGDCKAFVRRVQAALPQYTVLGLYSCPDAYQCHVSALVNVAGTAYVVDNGALGIPGSVMPLAEFDKWFDQFYVIDSLAAIGGK